MCYSYLMKISNIHLIAADNGCKNKSQNHKIIQQQKLQWLVHETKTNSGLEYVSTYICK